MSFLSTFILIENQKKEKKTLIFTFRKYSRAGRRSSFETKKSLKKAVVF